MDKPEALRLADVLDCVELRPSDYKDVDKAAAELRRLHAENERLHRFELANNVWHEKTDWVHETAQPLELGRHRADVLKQRIERLHAVESKYNELLFAVGSKRVGETRHDTALRYIKQAEDNITYGPAKATEEPK
jgi:hypothetical protein